MLRVIHLDEQSGLRGGEQQASWLVRGLAERGVTNILAGRAGEAFLSMNRAEKDAPGIALPLRGELDLISAWRLAKAANEYHAHIIHAHTSHAHAIAVLAKRLGARIRVVVSRRVDFMPKRHPLNRWKYRQADRILCVSRKVSETLATFGLHAPQVRVVHSAVDMERAMMPPVDRASLGVPATSPLLVSAGALVDHKDHVNLLRAVSLVRREFDDLRVCIAGDGPLRRGLDAERQALDLMDCVSFLGYRADAPAVTRAADVYVSSSWSEGLGTSILEALAAGTPVVATEAGGAREMVIPGETGCLVPPRDPEQLARGIIASLQDREKAMRMAEAGKSHVRNTFSVERMVDGTYAVYQELMDVED